MLRGRAFTTDDHETAPRVAIVNEAFARQFFGGADAIGKRVGLCSSDPCGSPPKGMMEIVGVTEDAKYADLREEKRSMLYVPFTQVEQNLQRDPGAHGWRSRRGHGDVYRELAAVDRRVAIVGMMQARDRVDASIVAETHDCEALGRLRTSRAGARRRRVIRAHCLHDDASAQGRSVYGWRSGPSVAMFDGSCCGTRSGWWSLGAAIGIPAALAGAHLLSSQLYQVGPSDPVAVSASIGALSCRGARRRLSACTACHRSRSGSRAAS